MRRVRILGRCATACRPDHSPSPSPPRAQACLLPLVVPVVRRCSACGPPLASCGPPCCHTGPMRCHRERPPPAILLERSPELTHLSSPELPQAVGSDL